MTRTRLTIVDEQGTTHELAADDLAKLPRKTVNLPDEPGATIEYQGVQLADVLEHCRVKLGKEVRGPRVASYVLVRSDGWLSRGAGDRGSRPGHYPG